MNETKLNKSRDELPSLLPARLEETGEHVSTVCGFRDPAEPVLVSPCSSSHGGVCSLRSQGSPSPSRAFAWLTQATGDALRVAETRN